MHARFHFGRSVVAQIAVPLVLMLSAFANAQPNNLSYSHIAQFYT